MRFRRLARCGAALEDRRSTAWDKGYIAGANRLSGYDSCPYKHPDLKGAWLAGLRKRHSELLSPPPPRNTP